MRIIFFFILALLSSTLIAKQKIEISSQQIFNLGVKTGKLTPVKSIPVLNAPAKVTIPPTSDYLVSTSYAGLVTDVNVALGDDIKKNQALAILKSPEMLALQRHHLKSINDLQLARIEFSRDQRLYKEGVITELRWLRTKTRFQVLRAHYNETKQLLEIAGFSAADIKKLEKKHQLNSQLKIVAPISGVLLQRNVTAGQRVDALTPLFRLANLDKLWLDISIPQQRIEHIHVGDQVVIDDLQMKARIFLVAKNVDETNQTVLARALVEMAHTDLRLGQTVNVKIRQNSQYPIFNVPNSALAQSSGYTYLFLRNKSGFIVQPVQILGREGGQTIITGNLQTGNEIAIRGAVALKAKFLGLGETE